MSFGVATNQSYKLKTPRAIHKVIVQSINLHKSTELVDSSALLPLKVVESLSEEHRELYERISIRKKAKPYIIRYSVISFFVGFGLVMLLWLSNTNSSRTFLDALIMGMIVGAGMPVFLLSMWWATKRERKWNQRHKRPVTVIHPEKIVCMQGYTVVLDRSINFGGIDWLMQQDIQSCSVCMTTINNTTFNSLVIRMSDNFANLVPIAPEESIEELVQFLRSHDYPVSKGEPLELNSSSMAAFHL